MRCQATTPGPKLGNDICRSWVPFDRIDVSTTDHVATCRQGPGRWRKDTSSRRGRPLLSLLSKLPERHRDEEPRQHEQLHRHRGRHALGPLDRDAGGCKRPRSSAGKPAQVQPTRRNDWEGPRGSPRGAAVRGACGLGAACLPGGHAAPDDRGDKDDERAQVQQRITPAWEAHGWGRGLRGIVHDSRKLSTKPHGTKGSDRARGWMRSARSA